MSCEFFFARAAGYLDGKLAGPDRDAMVLHLHGCAECRGLLASLRASDDPGLADAILARTSGSACERARSALCDFVDATLPAVDAELVDGHLRHCPPCSALARALAALEADLQKLAAADPGPGFVEVVLARTTRKERGRRLSTRWAVLVSSLLERPRIALEGAFVAAVVVGLPLASPSAPIAVRSTYVLADARDTINDVEAAVHVGARSFAAKARALVVRSAIRVPEGTFAGFGASGERGDEAAPEEKR